MKQNPLEQKLCTALEHAAPDNFDQVLARCESQKGVMFPMTTPKSKRFPFVAGAAAACLMLGVIGFGGYAYTQNQSIASIVSLDVNPSIELTLNRKERVLRATPLNDDAKIILADMDLKGTSIDVAVNAVMGSLLKNGYIDELANSILITVEDDDAARAAQLQTELTQTVNNVMESSSVNGAILSQTVQKTQDLTQKAEQYGISVGKAQLIDAIIAQNPNLNFEELASKNVNDLNLLASNQTTEIANVTSIGSASDGSYIGVDAAKSAALSHAGVSADAATFSDVEFDLDNGTMVYELEFCANGTEYEYDIDAKTGAVLKNNQKTQFNADIAAGSTAIIKNNPSSSADSSNAQIDEATAKSIALQAAGLTESQVEGLIVVSNHNNFQLVYKVKFWLNNTEYFYAIDAASGQILKHETHGRNSSQSYNNSYNNSHNYAYNNSSNNTLTNAIGQDAALTAALNHAGVSKTDIYDLEIEDKLTKRTPYYSIEFKANGIEYEYEVNAQDGSILKSEQNRDD